MWAGRRRWPWGWRELVLSSFSSGKRNRGPGVLAPPYNRMAAGKKHPLLAVNFWLPENKRWGGGRAQGVRQQIGLPFTVVFLG
jgi:hypothetical protein